MSIANAATVALKTYLRTAAAPVPVYTGAAPTEVPSTYAVMDPADSLDSSFPRTKTRQDVPRDATVTCRVWGTNQGVMDAAADLETALEDAGALAEALAGAGWRLLGPADVANINAPGRAVSGRRVSARFSAQPIPA